jgi:hypothetical protein
LLVYDWGIIIDGFIFLILAVVMFLGLCLGVTLGLWSGCFLVIWVFMGVGGLVYGLGCWDGFTAGL